MAQQHLFIADAHFGRPEHIREVEQDLLSLIEVCRRRRIKIHILGDLFDYWMEYPEFTPGLGNRILEAFSSYMEEMGSVLYITGNHDNWTCGYFSEIGFDVEPEYRLLTIDGWRVFLHHGDGLRDRSLGLPRPVFHRLLRHPLFIRLYQRLLPPAAGLELMRRFSELSRSKPSADPEPLNRWAEKYLDRADVDFVISGHDHTPRVETFPGGCYLNTGPFYPEKTLVYYNNNCFQLVVWDRMRQDFETVSVADHHHLPERRLSGAAGGEFSGM